MRVPSATRLRHKKRNGPRELAGCGTRGDGPGSANRCGKRLWLEGNDCPRRDGTDWQFARRDRRSCGISCARRIASYQDCHASTGETRINTLQSRCFVGNVAGSAMIPNVFHFLFGFKPNDPFLLYHYLTIASAIKHNQPDAVHVWIHHEPRGEWWQRAVKLPLVEIHAITPPVAIFGNPLLHYAHQADIVRLQVIEKYGGIYLDIDTIVYKDMSPLRLNSQCVMGWQSNDGL